MYEQGGERGLSLSRQHGRRQPAADVLRPIGMGQTLTSLVAVLGNLILIAALVWYGFTLFAEYHATGKWAKNITGLLGGIGMFVLAFSLVITPANAEVIMRVAQTKASSFFLWLSSLLLLAAIAAYGIITYSKPFRLWHERRIRRDLNRDLPKIP